MQYPVQTLPQKFLVHIFRPSGQEQLDFDPVPLLDPPGGGFGLQFQIVVAGAYFYLDGFCFRPVRSGFGLFQLFVRLVLVFAKIHQLGNRRIAIRGYLNQIKTLRFRQFQGVFYA
ncbi:MAG: hypothetical protein UW07_C0035G0009 [Candidatus Nomurabacteria bacterium GW2011_GWF2_43_8]|uniref:Uncharacterized protein n=3 Tax=Candidatus Nomuraibacteriota TaxID=1752729 RepID=A0A0G1FKH3_9BACT|nr:MAG: hypothetical protein UV76_C0002G0089 [Candidatus Nomurabacteria bacterium GW2011_GWA2_43_15]KKT19868.1 MAG: hypothetical protein UW02_C0004G0045 [Candidatus Nomurabacteria bacterium GW2011_GWB1_43_7]KKT22488.1 MAG: hypothetical protein UW07_C0035G0009 [Candidatus Nomurabacteria bacterium GW2011_GWF2_43_8]